MNRCLIFAFLLTAPLHAESLITWKRLQLNDKFYAEGANSGDINKDGKIDIISGPYWYEGPDWQKKHAFYEPKEFSINGYSDNFFCYARDFNADGWQDILVLGFPGKEARLYLSPGTFAEDKLWAMSIVADVVDNESPVFTDITGDGKPEIVCSTGGRFGWFAPNWDKPAEKWPFVAVSDDMKVAKFTHGLGVGDVNADGKLDLLEARRWWEQGSSTTFAQHTFGAGLGGGAQMFAYDFDGDGRNDVATALAAHRYGVAVFMNRAGNEGAQWEKRMLVGEQPWENDYGIVFSQPHAMHLADIDGDGIQDLVTGKRYWAHNGHDPDERNARVIYWFQTKRLPGGKVEFVPRLIDANSGVGVDVQVGDLNGDKLPDIVVGNKAGVFALLQERNEVSAETAAQMEPKKLYGSGLMAQKDYKAGQTAQEALKHLQLPTGFKAELIAAEPDIVQPIAMCWDERGRLWVVEGNSYPQPREPGAGQDRILILEDTNGDGTFETRKVFAEGISLASGIEVGFGGVWVGAAPYLMFIADKDRDDKPDAAEVANPVPGLNFKAQMLLDGWGSQDTHETLNSFIWGPDGWLYGCHGVFTHSKVGKPGAAEDQRTPINAGVWRYHPVRHTFEVFAHGTSNPWGLDYDQYGEFFVTACVIPHLYHIVPGGRYQRQAGPHFNPYTFDDIKTIGDHLHYSGNLRPDVTHDKTTGAGIANDDTNARGGGHAHCGLAIYQSSQFPATYRNQLIFGNLHGHRLVSNYLDPKASTYIGKHGSDFMRANDMNFVPVTQKVGPDGALYVSDWSDKQVCHRGSNAVELWDRSNGRIYRVSYAAAKLNETNKSVRAPLIPKAPFDLTKESDEILVKLAVQTDNDWFSRMARRVVTERAASSKAFNHPPSVAMMVDHLTATKAENRQQLLALWALTSMGRFDFDHLQATLASTNEVMRVWAIRNSASEVRFHGANLKGVEDNMDSVRLDTAAASKEGRFPGCPENMLTSAILNFAVKETAPNVRRELASLLQRLPPSAMMGTQGIPQPTEQERQVAWPGYVLARTLLKHGEDKEDPYIPLLLWYGIEPVVGADPKAGLELAKISKMPKVTEFVYRRLGAEESGRTALLGIAAETQDAVQRETLLRTVIESARSGNKVAQPANWATLKEKLGTTPQVAELEAFMGIPEAKQAFRAQLANTELPRAKRESALTLLIQVRDVETAPLLTAIIRADDKALTRRAVQALSTLSHEETPALLIEKFAGFDAGVKIDAVNTLATNATGAQALLLAVKDKKVPNSMLSPFLARQMDTLKSPEVQALLKEVWGDLNAPKADLPQRKQKFRTILTKDAVAQADVAKGRMIFGATCGTCHRLYGEGADVGPDLTGSNRMDLDYLLDNVLDPNAVIGKAYQLNIFELTDGRITSGVIKEETPVAFRVAMPGGLELNVTKAEIKKRTLSPMSTMPEGLFDALPPEMLLQVVAYLQSRAPDQGAATTAAAIPGALEGESLKSQPTAGKVRTQGMANFKAGHWSGNQHLWWTGAKTGDKLTITFPVAKAGKQKLHAVFTKAPDYGKVTFKVDGKPSPLGEVDLYDQAVVNTSEQFLGDFDFKAGDHQLEVTITGKNPDAKPAQLFALDYLRLE